MLIYITGGCRSGKSRYALARGEALPGPRRFVATCPVLDDEMNARVDRHRTERAGRGWQTVDAPVDPASAVDRSHDVPVVLVDCLTLWVNNLLCDPHHGKPHLTEDDAASHARTLAEACRRHPGTVLVVTNEVGLGIVPGNDLSRQFRDLLGRVNQVLAAAAEEAVLMVSGLPMVLKGS